MLFIKEFKKTVFSIGFVIFLVAVFALAAGQDVMDFAASGEIIREPQKGADYGIQTKEEPEIIMPSALEKLFYEFTENSYVAYPIGFYKNVKLSDRKQDRIAAILAELTGRNASDFKNLSGKDTELSDSEWEDMVRLRKDVTYEKFLQCMENADQLIGGGSHYSHDNLIEDFGRVPVTYKEAVKQYKLGKDYDHFTGAYARLFCDYIGIVLSLLPVFLAVSGYLKDKKAGMRDMIYVRKTSSFQLVITRYLSILSAVMLPVLVLAYISNGSVWEMYSGKTLDYLAPLKYGLGWLLPSVMISTAVGMFLSELTDTPIAIAIQGLWWFIDLNKGISGLKGGYKLFQLSPRHNTLGNTQVYIDGFHTLAANRLIFAGVSLVLAFATVAVYEQKRKGNFNGFRKTKKFSAALADSEGKFAA